MVDKAKPNRIPADDSGDWHSWRAPSIDNDGRVIPSDERQARDESGEPRRAPGETVEDVELAAEGLGAGLTAEQLHEIVESAEKDGFEQGRRDGYRAGYDEGYETGQHQGRDDMRQQLVAEQQTFRELAEALRQPVNEQDERLETLMLTMVTRMAKAVVMRELTQDSGDVVALVREAIGALPSGESPPRVELNPDDLAVVESYAEEHGYNWSFRADEALAPGGVKVSTDESLVDDSVERRIEEITERFMSQQGVDETTSDAELGAGEPDGEPGHE